MKIEYARVSTQEQNLALQRDALRKAGCRKIYAEVISGAGSSAPSSKTSSRTYAKATS